MEKLKPYLEDINRKAGYAEELYGIRIRYVPLIVEKRTIVFDRQSFKIKVLEEDRCLSPEEAETLEEKILENIKKGMIELYLTLTFGEDVGLGES
ncbi:MAG: hypothetical protein PWP49_559 [Thermococcaceae archaeon]|jgi:hypothetical protein|uniref:hypothetical protein n=1 Tax=Thermococcus TaxID=2263 RepID=UPI0005B2AEFD|nr:MULTISPECIES: hypothetical protein [Thermococcus]MDK2784084.1 hypothetical protein [Thermococcaceae archaeon]MCA6212748.1 hypothetical protein [Thermococcus bergensis]MDK2853380.1 hypothetical protein [Thermococcaceae archaeon]MDN5320139.1 hypothetical protein [Thermococcaceae archaeon]MPW39448.1 hypothetical protein [Thermococcus sp. 101 C5]